MKEMREITKAIENVVNGSYKVTEKKKMLQEIRERTVTEINRAVERVEQGYKYCPQCKEWYREKAWEMVYKNETREVCTFHDPCEFGEDKYENKDCTITLAICPMGHVIEEEVKW